MPDAHLTPHQEVEAAGILSENIDIFLLINTKAWQSSICRNDDKIIRKQEQELGQYWMIIISISTKSSMEIVEDKM